MQKCKIDQTGGYLFLDGSRPRHSAGRYQTDTNVLTYQVYGTGSERMIKVADLRSVRQRGQQSDFLDDLYRLGRQIDRASLLLASALGFADDDLRGVDGKLRESIVRARSKVFELAMCNDWEWFFTGTLDGKRYNRYDLDVYHKDFTRFIKNLNNHRDDKIKFLIVPETHQDGAWHFHGFLMGLQPHDLRQFRLGDKMGNHIAEKVLHGEVVCDWPDYSERFGFCDLEPIRSKEAVSKYVTKYISKTLGEDIKEAGAHLYYRSRGLAGAQELGRTTSVYLRRSPVLVALGEPTFVGDYCNVWWLPYTDDLADTIKQNVDPSD